MSQNALVSSLETEYKTYLGTLPNDRISLELQMSIMGHDQKLYNRYRAAGGRSEIAVSFRSFTISELPNNFRNCAISSPGNRAMIEAIKGFCGDPYVAQAMEFINNLIARRFTKGSYLFYAFQTKVDNVHMFFYSDRETHEKVVVQLLA